MNNYKVNEIFYSIQGEGQWAGKAAIFVRFAHCNMKCGMDKSTISPGEFICDTEFDSFTSMNGFDILEQCNRVIKKELGSFKIGVKFPTPIIVFTGGEPALQLDSELCNMFRSQNFDFLAIETNGSVDLKVKCKGMHSCGTNLDWVCVSPKVENDRLLQKDADEWKILCSENGLLCCPDFLLERKRFKYKSISPIFDVGKTLETVNKKALLTAINIVKENPSWKLTTQNHKIWEVR